MDRPEAPPPAAIQTLPRWAGTTRRLVAASAVTLAALLVALAGITRPLAGLDESATLLAVQRPWGGVLALFHGADAPLVPYYLLAKSWLWACSGLPTLTGLRLSSAVAAAFTAGLMFLLVTRSGGLWTGIVAAAVLVAIPGFSRYAQEARPSALLGLGVTLSWLLWSARVHPSASHRWRIAAAVAYPLSLAGSLLTSLFAVFQWPAQALAGLTAGRTDRRWWGASALTFLAAGALAGVPAWLALRNGTGPRVLPTNDPATVLGTLARAVDVQAGPALLPVALGLLAAVGFGTSVRTADAGGRERAAMAAWWLLVPTALSLAVVLVHPGLLQPRYLHPALVPLSILVADGIVACARWGSRAGRPVGAATGAVVLLAVVGLAVPSQLAVRDTGAHEWAAPSLLAAVDAAFVDHPDARLLATSTSAAVVLSASRPELAARNAALKVDPWRDEIWPCRRPRRQELTLLEGTAPVVWVSPAKSAIDPPPSRMPAVLTGSGFEISGVARAGKWFVVTLVHRSFSADGPH